MDQNILNDLMNNSNMSQNDINLISNLFSSINSGKKPNISMKDRDKLLSKLSSMTNNNSNNDNIVTKDTKNMTPEELEAYRAENRRKLQEKKNQFKLNRTNKKVRENIINNKNNKSKKLSEMTEEEKELKREEIRKNLEIARKEKELEEQELKEQDNKTSETLEKLTNNSDEEDFDDYIN